MGLHRSEVEQHEQPGLRPSEMNAVQRSNRCMQIGKSGLHRIGLFATNVLDQNIVQQSCTTYGSACRYLEALSQTELCSSRRLSLPLIELEHLMGVVKGQKAGNVLIYFVYSRQGVLFLIRSVVRDMRSVSCVRHKP